MNLSVKFSLFDRVKITELEQNGLVFCISVDSVATMYKVRYFHNGEAKEVYFLESELEAV